MRTLNSTELHSDSRHSVKNVRVERYRRLALEAKNPDVRRLLLLIADEAQTGILCISPFKKEY
jgi:hypothetical protein